MTNQRKIVVVFLFGLFVIIAQSRGGNGQAPKQTSAPISVPSKARASNPQKSSIYPNHPNSPSWQIQSWNIRFSYVIPALDQILKSDLKCANLIDNQKAFDELKGIYFSKEDPSKFLPFWDANFNSDLKYLGDAKPEMEKKIQDGTIGHICFFYANKTTIEALGSLQKKYPCSEASVVALLLIKVIIYRPGYPVPAYENGNMISYNEQYVKLNHYIIDHYPNSWEAEQAILSIALYPSYPSKFKNGEWVAAQENLIRYYENNNILNNKYYKFYIHNKDPYREFLNTYSFLSEYYLDNCEELSRNGVAKNGKISQEAFDMYNKNVDL